MAFRHKVEAGAVLCTYTAPATSTLLNYAQAHKTVGCAGDVLAPPAKNRSQLVERGKSIPALYAPKRSQDDCEPLVLDG